MGIVVSTSVRRLCKPRFAILRSVYLPHACCIPATAEDGNYGGVFAPGRSEQDSPAKRLIGDYQSQGKQTEKGQKHGQ